MTNEPEIGRMLKSGELHRRIREARPDCVDRNGAIHRTPEQAAFVNWRADIEEEHGKDHQQWPVAVLIEFDERYWRDWRGITDEASIRSAQKQMDESLDTVQRVASAFSRIIRRDIGEHVEEVNRRNAAADDGGCCCATHDFIDANVAMIEAYEEAVGPWSVDDANCHETIEQAWSMAQSAGFKL